MLFSILVSQALFVVSMSPTVYGWVFWKYKTDGTVVSVGVSSNGGYTIAGTDNGSIFLLDSNGSLLWQYHFTVNVKCVAISGDGSRIVAGIGEYRIGEPDIYLFDNLGNIMWQKDLVQGSWPLDAAISPDAQYIVTGDTANFAYFYDISGNLIWNYTAGGWVSAVSTSSGGEYTAAGSWDDTLYFFDKSGNILWSQDFEYDVDAVSVSPDGEYIAAGCPIGEDLSLFANNGSLLLKKPFYISIRAVSVSANADRIVVGDFEKITVIDKMANTMCERQIDTIIEDVAITTDGKYVASGCGDNVYYLETLPSSEITCIVSKSEIDFGESIIVSGNVTPPIAGAQLMLTYTRPDRSNVPRATITDQYGLYSDSYTPDMAGDWKVNASWIGNEQYAGSESSSQSFTVGKSSIMCDVSPEVIFFGGSVTVNGSIHPPPTSSVQVTLVYKLYFQNSSYNYEGFVKETKNITTLPGGTFLDAFTPSQEGRWRIEVSWAGDAEHMPSQAEALFVVNPAAQNSLLSATTVTLYWLREQWYCTDHYFMDMEIPTSNQSQTVAFNPWDYWWIGHGHWEFKGIHTGQLSEGILIEKGLWNLSIWATAREPSQHFQVSLYYWDENHDSNLIASWNTGYFNSTSSDVPTQFTHSFDLPAKIIPKGSCLGFKIYDCRDSNVKWFFDSTLHPSYLTIPSSTEVVSYTLNIMPATGGNTSPESGIYTTYVQGTEVAVTATPQAGYSFDHWRLDGINIGSTNPVDILMDKNHTLLAVFVDNIPPQIGSPTQDPFANIEPNQNVTVTVTVTDHGSGICNVTLGYSIDNGTTWIPLNMSKIGANAYQTKIPEYENWTSVRYKITAYDNAGNPAVNDNAGRYYIYQVIPEFPTAVSMLLLVFFLTTIVFISQKYTRKIKFASGR
jgi:hypothetical protein